MFKDNLKILREQKHISKKTMALRLGIPYGTYQNYENTNREPPYALLKKIASVLMVSVDLLLSDSLETTPTLELETLPAAESHCFTPASVLTNFFSEEEIVALWNALESEMDIIEETHKQALQEAMCCYAQTFKSEIALACWLTNLKPSSEEKKKLINDSISEIMSKWKEHRANGKPMTLYFNSKYAPKFELVEEIEPTNEKDSISDGDI